MAKLRNGKTFLKETLKPLKKVTKRKTAAKAQTIVQKSHSITEKAKAPKNWQHTLDQIEQMRHKKTAAVDTMGCETVVDEQQYKPHENRFRILISALLSSQTKDQVNAAAMTRLDEHGLSIANILQTPEAKLAELIRPVSFFNTKAKNMLKICQLLHEKASETKSDPVDIPDTYQGLVALPGIGPKMAHLIMNCAWDKSEGICVDIHVHRISNRLGWVKTWNKQNPKAQNPEKTREELQQWLPYKHWKSINPLLVGFGQEICRPVNPKCEDCLLRETCPSSRAKSKSTTSRYFN